MSYPNSALSAWQLALIAVVAAAALAVWLVTVFLAAREPRPDSAASAATERTRAGEAVLGGGTGQPEPTREARDRLAA